MKKNIYLLTGICCITASVCNAQILNQTTKQTNANFNIDGNGMARSFRASDSTIGTGNTHFVIYQRNSMRWGLGTGNVESGAANQGSDFRLYAYQNNGVYLGTFLTVMRSNGFTGIGTSVPTAQLHVAAASQLPLAKFTYGDVSEANAALIIGNATGSGSYIPCITGRAYSPGRPYGLALNGEAEDVTPTSSEPSSAAIVLDGRSKTSTRLANANVLTIRSYTIPLVTVKANGSMGIGTTNTGTNKLAVEGTIAARKIKVTQATTWPDYVFEQGYQLPSLQSVETFIKENKHLPDVPSARDIAENGQDIGEVNSLLLKKVEELTLHLIKMEKELEAVKAANDVLSRQVKVIRGKI